MRLLICSSLAVDRPTAGRNRLMRMSRAVAAQGIEAIFVGSQAGLGTAWREVELQELRAIAFDPELTGARGYCSAMTKGARSSAFYREYLPELIQDFDVQGVISYDPQAQVVQSIQAAAHDNNCFVVADLVELFGVKVQYLLNGINYQQLRLVRQVLPKMDGIIGISHGWCEWARQRNLPHVWCPSFAEDCAFVRTSPSLEKPFTLTFVGYWIDRELPRVFLKALRLCIDRGLDIQLNVIGNTGKTWREQAAMRLVRSDPELRKRVNFLGFVSDSERDRYFADSDAFILLRRDTRETDMLFPTRLPEYMVTGNPVILSKVGSFSRCFKHHHDICFVSPRNHPEEVADTISFLADNPQERFEIGQNGRRTALDQFSLDRLGSRLAKFLREIAEHSRVNKIRSEPVSSSKD